MRILFKILVLVFFSMACQQSESSGVLVSSNPSKDSLKHIILNPEGDMISKRFNPPEGYSRIPLLDSSFGSYLRRLPLLTHGSPVLYYDGQEKGSDDHAAILNLDVGTRDLQQCADAIMRIRSEYFFKEKHYDSISFHFVNGFEARYTRWADGERIGVKGNKTYWYGSKEKDLSYDTFRDYLIMVYSYAGTASMEKELKPKNLEDLEIGDVFIQGGSPGHAMLVMDMVQNEEGAKAFMLAQSYMPAQSIHIVKNLTAEDDSPWYFLKDVKTSVETPSWIFETTDLHGF